MGTFYLTTPIYYVNAPPHLGHAYTMIVADATVRWWRLRGQDVFFLTGTDEHGDKIAQAAASEGVSPQELADRNSAAFRTAWQRLGIRYDDFIRTTEERHKRVVQQILQTLWDKGEIYLGKYGGQYCFGCERFYTEKEIVDGKCPDHQTPLTYIEEENYFFRMSKYQDWLVHQIENRPNLIRPERYRNEIIGFLRDPLQDLSISRPRKRLQWGIPLPFDDNYVTYVWFDALINYVSALGGPGDPRFDRYWPHAQHLIGKDILKPHAVYWPCMLHAAGIDVFRHLHVHGYWMISGRKISKSVGNLVEALALSEKYGNDVFRYFVLREMVFGLDAEFSEEALVGRLNADLANDLGNLVSRVTTLLVNLRDGIVPERAPHPGIQTVVSSIIGNIDEGLHDRGLGFDRGLSQIWTLVRTLNQEVDGQQPWALAKDPTQQKRLDEVLYALAEAVRILGVLLSPFVPDAAAKIRAALDQAGEPRDGDVRWGGLAPGTRVQKLSGLFPRIREDAEAEASEGPPTARQPTRRRGDAPGGGANAAENERISIDDFGRVELRVAEVIAAEAVAKSKKLLKLTVSLGQETRTVLAGIAEHYGPADLVGKKVVVVANLKPAKLMGIESDGMVLAGSSDGQLAVVTVDHDLPAGARVK